MQNFWFLNVFWINFEMKYLGITDHFGAMLAPRMDGGRKVSMDHVNDHPMFVILGRYLNQIMFIVVVCVCARFLIFDNLSWQVASDQWTSVIAWQVYISRYCCTLVSALEAGNGDAWSEGQDSLGQDGRVLPENGGGNAQCSGTAGYFECWGLVWANFLPWALDRWNAFPALGTWSLDNLNSFAYPKFSQMFPKTSFFSRNIFFLTFGESRQY